MNFKSFLRVILFSAIGLCILWFMYRNQQAAYLEDCLSKGVAAEDCSLIDKILNDFASVKWIWLLVIMAVFMISNLSRTFRWQQILKADGFETRWFNVLGAVMVGYFVNLGIPRGGEVARCALLNRYDKVPLENALASVVIDRIADVLALLVLLLLSLVIAGDIVMSFMREYGSPEKLWLIVGGLAVFGIGVFLALRFLRNRQAQGHQSWFLEKSKNFLEGVASIRRLENVPMFLVHTFVIWFCYFLMTYLCFFAFEPTAHLGPQAGYVLLVLGTLGVVFPSPGGMGSYHFLVTQGLLIYNILPADAFSFANILFFAIQLFVNVVLGLVFLILLPIYNNRS